MTDQEYRQAREAKWSDLIDRVNQDAINLAQSNAEFDTWTAANRPDASRPVTH